MGSTPPFTIPIGTSDPVDLSSGLALFPSLGALRAGISASSRSYKLFDVPILIVCTRLNLSVYAGYGFGIVGPSIAFLSKEVSITRENVQGVGGQLTLSFDDGLRMQAGAFVGAYVAAGVSGNLEIYLPRPWYKIWAWSWKQVFTFEKDFKVDLLKLMYQLIKYLLSKSGDNSSFTQDKENKLKQVSFNIDSFGMAGSSNGIRPDLTARPGVTVPFNLANYVPKLKEVNQGLAKIGGEISFGPTAHLQFPVTLNIDGFTVTGGLQGTDSADYGQVQYRSGNQVTARGTTLFTRENPSRFTTHVNYRTSVRLALSIHASVKVAKFFSIGVNTPSLDLTYLLFRRPESNGAEKNSVSTSVGGGCVLTPNMTLRFEGPNSSLEILTGELAKGTITLAGFQSSRDATISLEIDADPQVTNFPSSVTLAAGAQSVQFPFTFRNQCLATGNRNNLSETAPPNPISALQTYRVRATLEEQSVDSCSDYQAETPLNITNRVLRCQRFRTTYAGTSPPWDYLGLASATIKATIDDPRAPTGNTIAYAVLSFPYVSNEQPQIVPVTFTLLDENRQPYARSDVEVYTNAERKALRPSCTLDVSLLKAEEAQNAPNPSLAIEWNSKGQNTGYPNRFYLLLDAGCQYGQTEFWLDVYNWS